MAQLRSYARVAALALTVSSYILIAVAELGAASNSASSAGAAATSAEHLVQSAMKAELQGDAAQRAALLREAVRSYPENARARWQSGEVRFQGQWRTPVEVAKLVSADKRWQEYKQLRREAQNTAADHARLAQWCLRHGLEGEERFHWANVLLADPRHEQARQRLALREFRGGLFTTKQVAEYEQRAKQAADNLKKFKPKYVQLVRQSRSEDAALREAALREIRATSDATTLDAINYAIEKYGRTEKADEMSRALELARITALARMREHEATLHLLNHAMFSPFDEVRRQAAESLSTRPTTDYMPLLMSAMAAPIEAEFDFVAASDGTVRMTETITQSGPEADASHVRSTNLEVAGVEGIDRAAENPALVLQGHLARAAMRAKETKARVDAFNEEAAQRNVRIQEVVKIATGMDLGDDPEAYWRAWGAENELYYGGTEEPVFTSYEYDTSTYTYQQAPVYEAAPGGPPSGTTRVAPPSQPAPPQPPRVINTSFECFAAGTPVWTQAGTAPIEQVAVGDMVLSQDPNSGELTYRAVLQTTVGEPTRMLRVSLGSEQLVSTGGHRFWVNGVGWIMAKELKESMGLHGASQNPVVARMEEVEPSVCYNLVVDEFHTFFVGESQVLVHDKTCPQPTMSVVPGAGNSLPPVAR